MQAEIICVGTELLVGSIVNTNASFLARKLAENAIDCYRHTTVGDNIGRIVKALEDAAGRAELLITTGGLGPTEDDVTVQAIAEFLSKPLVFHKPTHKAILNRLKIRKLRMTRLIARQCFLPQGATVFANPNGTAAGLLCQTILAGQKKWLIVLPGPPRELELLFTQYVFPAFLKKAKPQKAHFVIRSVRITGLIEAQVAQRVNDLLKLKPPVTVGIYAKPSEVELKIMSKAASRKKAKEATRRVEKIICSRLREKVYGFDNDTLPAIVGNLLRKKKRTLAVAESCTGGLLSNMITDIAGSSDYFKGGVVVYATDSKSDLLKIPSEIIQRKDVVSREMATALAKAARNAFKADIGIGVTGNAGPTTGDSKNPVGLVFIAVAGKHGAFVKKYRFLGNRAHIKSRAAHEALDLIRLCLKQPE